MITLDRTFFESLAAKLGTLENVSTGKDRSKSWMTAEEITEWWSKESGGHKLPSDQVDVALVEHWENDEGLRDLRIRPAKYPDAPTVCRLWGHESRVGKRDRHEIWQRRSDPQLQFETLKLSPDADWVFVSYSLLDHELAVQVRGELANFGYRAWLAEEQIAEGELIFEAVRAALKKAVAKVFLISGRSLGSAWVYTELVGGADSRRAMVFDGTNLPLMALLSTWHQPTAYGEQHFREDLLSPLQKAYQKDWDDNMQPGRQVLDGAAGTSSGWKRRPDKFLEGAKELLENMGSATLSIYPYRPKNWTGPGKFVDFPEAMSDLLRFPRI
jgi:hypothetical protein